MTPNTVSSADDAFALLRAGAEGRLARVRAGVGAAAQRGEYDTVQQLVSEAKELEGLLEELAAMAERYQRLVEPAEKERQEPVASRLARGRKTPQSAYRVPILRALVELGGQANINAVLDRVYEMMQHRLNEHDLAPLASNENMPRWRNTAQWERNRMREEGLIRDDTPRGVWAISDAGRRWLQGQGGMGE